MAYTITLEISLTVTDEKQEAALQQAACSGLLETIIKDRVLFGGQAPVSVPVAISSADRTKDKAEEAAVVLQAATIREPRKQIEIPKPERTRNRGVFGRTQIERSGRG